MTNKGFLGCPTVVFGAGDDSDWTTFLQLLKITHNTNVKERNSNLCWRNRKWRTTKFAYFVDNTNQLTRKPVHPLLIAPNVWVGAGEDQIWDDTKGNRKLVWRSCLRWALNGPEREPRSCWETFVKIGDMCDRGPILNCSYLNPVSEIPS